MERQQFSKHYSKILLRLALISIIILVITPFIPALSLQMGWIVQTETGVDYLSSLFDFKEIDSKVLIQDGVDLFFMKLLTFVLLAAAVSGTVVCLAQLTKDDDGTLVSRLFFVVARGFLANAFYYLFCTYIILNMYGLDMSAVFSPDATVKTTTHFPLILQAVIMAIASGYYIHWLCAVNGKTRPLNSGSQSEQTYQKTGNDTPGYYSYEESQREKHQEETGENYSYNNSYEEAESDTKEDSQKGLCCHKCGYPLDYEGQPCANCGGKTKADEKKTHKMKWYKFLVFFSLILGGITNIISGVIYLTGITSVGSISELQTLNRLYGMVCIALGILNFVTRSSLRKFKQNGPTLVFTLYIIVAISSFLYSVAFGAIVSQMSVAFPSIFTLIAGLIMAFANRSYFSKRMSLFVN